MQMFKDLATFVGTTESQTVRHVRMLRMQNYTILVFSDRRSASTTKSAERSLPNSFHAANRFLASMPVSSLSARLPKTSIKAPFLTFNIETSTESDVLPSENFTVARFPWTDRTLPTREMHIIIYF